MSLSVDGLVSGLDTTSIVSQIIQLERRPITMLENKQVTLANQKAAWQGISTVLLGLESAVNKLNTTSRFSEFTSKFSNNNSTGGNVLSVSAGNDTSAGTYDVKVSQLAQAQKSVSGGTYADTTSALGASGTITIGGSVNVTVALTDTLEDVKNNINTSGATVTATIINTSTAASPSYELLITGNNAGSSNSFTITDATDGTTNIAFGTTQSAQNALLTLDGISITKDSNTITDLIFDATINLETIGSGTITFASDSATVITNINGFVDAYNAVVDSIKEQFTYNSSKNTSGDLFGNVSLQTIQNQIRNVLTSSVPGIDGTDSSKIAYLSQIGITTDDLDHLAVDSAKLKDALVNRFTEVRDIFTPSGSGTYTFVSADGYTTGGVYNSRVVNAGGLFVELQLQGGDGSWVRMEQTGNFATGASGTILEGLILKTGTTTEGETGTIRIGMGVAARVSHLTAKYTEYSTEGLIFNQYDSIDKQDRDLQKQVDDLEERIGKKEEDLKAKFVKLETLLASLTSQQSYLDSQLANLSRGWK